MRICIIPARAGSKRIPGKNKKEFFGKRMIEYPLTLAVDSHLFDHLIVSTDDDEVANAAQAYKDEGTFISIAPRDAFWAGDDVPTLSLIREVLLSTTATTVKMRRRIEGADKAITKNSVCVIYPCSPLLMNTDLLNGMQLLYASDMDYAFSVGLDPLRDAGNYYWGWENAFLDLVPIHGPRSIMVPIPEERCCDINTPADWEEAEHKYNALNLARMPDMFDRSEEA